MKKIAVIVYGPPGSGKGTQANLLANKTSLMHFDTGHFLESLWYDPARAHDRIVQRERKLFEAGKLNTPSVVLREVIREVRNVARAGWSLVFSGSPRTIYEAEGLMPLLAKLYGKRNVYVFVLAVPAKVSIRRNSARRVCSVCGQGLLSAYYPKTKTPPKYCPICGGTFYRRSLDKPEIIKARLKEYQERTVPVLRLAQRFGFHVRKIDGAPAPYRVYKKIYADVKSAIRH